MGDGAVLVAYLHPNRESHSFSDSLMRLVAWDMSHDARVVRTGGPLMFRCGPGGLVEARNDVVKHFLDNTGHEWLWSVDSDMGFAGDTVDRLLAAAHPKDRPIVGGLCFAWKEYAPDGMGGWRTRPVPTLYDWARKADGEFGFSARSDYPVNSLVQVAGTGSACVLIHRSALERIRDSYGDTWFDRTKQASGLRVSEDLSFCYRAATVDARVFVHTGVRTTHHKDVWVGEDDFWRSVVPEPATEMVDVIVPVLRRPQNAEPFMRSLRASTGLARVFAVAQDDDVETAKAWAEAGATLVPSGARESFAMKVNDGFAASDSPWVFLVGDDVRFHAGWLDHAQQVAGRADAQVVGTNDLGNPRVTAGEHATHLLIRRSYVESVGASWDGPGVVCHEGYRHWFVDDELVLAAKQRGVWAMALGSLVEHLHPAWGKAPMDDVYELGQRAASGDERLFKSRFRAHAS